MNQVFQESKSLIQYSAKERFNKYIANEEVDHLPYFMIAPDEAMANIYGYTTKEFHNNIEILIEVKRRMQEDYQIEGLNVGFSTRTIANALGSVMNTPEIGLDSISNYMLTDPTMLKKLDVIDPYQNTLLYGMLEKAEKLRMAFPEMNLSTSVAGPLSTAASLRPIELLKKDAENSKSFLNDLLTFVNLCNQAWIETFIKEFGLVSTSISDPSSSSDFIDYKFFKTFSEPHLKQLVNLLEKKTQSKPWLHICGHSAYIWSDLANCGLSGLSVDGCEDIESLKNTVGNQMFLFGNVPHWDTLYKGSTQEIIESVKDNIIKAADSPKGYQVSTGCHVPIGTSQENIEAYIYASRIYGHTAKMGELPQGIYEQEIKDNKR